MRNFEELDADEQKIVIDYLRKIGDDINNADEYTIYDEEEALVMMEESLMSTIDRIEDEYGTAFAPRLSDVMKYYDIEDFFIEIGVDMFIKRE